MSVGSVLIGLQASRKDGRGVTSGEFLAPLNIKRGEVEHLIRLDQDRFNGCQGRLDSRNRILGDVGDIHHGELRLGHRRAEHDKEETKAELS